MFRLGANGVYVPIATSIATPSWYRPAGPVYTGQPNLNTGWTNLPGGAGSLTTFSGPLTANGTYTNMDMGAQTITVDNPTFNGCRFKASALNTFLIHLATGCTKATFNYCSLEPGTIAWSQGVNVPAADSYQYGIGSTVDAAVIFSHCDEWGFGNALNPQVNQTQPWLIDHSWIHDACTDPAAGYHVDGPGWLQGSVSQGWANFTITNNTIESLGNTNGIAMQQGVYSNGVITGNYLGGFGYTVAVWATSTGITFTDNVYSTELASTFGPLYPQTFWTTSGSTWLRNRWHSADTANGGGNLGAGDATRDGLFWLPVTTANAGDAAYTSAVDF